VGGKAPFPMIDRGQKTILPVAALLLLGVVLATALVSDPRGARAVSPEASIPAASELAAPAALELAHDASGAEHAVREVVPEGAVAASAAPLSSVVLRGRLREHAPSEASVLISVSGAWGGSGVMSKIERLSQRYWPASHEATGALYLGWDGSFELDVSELFRPGRPHALAVEATSEGRVGWASVSVGEAGADGVGPRVLSVTLDLDRPREVSGEVHGGPGARVAAFHLVEGLPVRHAAGYTRAAADGSFALSLPVANSYLIVAYAEGLRPVSRESYLGFERSGYLPAFYLDVGATIKGRVTLGGRSVSATVTAAPERDVSRGFVAGPDELFLIDGRFEWGATSARAEHDGDFELTGLAPGDYRVRLSGVALEEGGTVGRLPTSIATAPAVGLDLSPDAARVRLEFHGDLAALAETGYALEQDFGRAGKTRITVRPNAEGLAELWLSPGDPVRGVGTSFEFLPRDCAGGPPCVVDVVK
jgi:hypothetical protein